MELMKYSRQKQLSRKYVRWLYDLLNDGKLHDLKFAEKVKDFPSRESIDYITYGNGEGEQTVRYFDRIFHCGDNLTGFINPKTEKYIVTDGFFCEHRMCPVCATKTSLREYSKITFQMEQFQDKYEYYMLTLTLPNNPDGFKEEINILSKCLSQFCRYFKYDSRNVDTNACAGVYGSFEITKSSKGWHPHLHLILAFPKENIVKYEANTIYDGKRNRTFVTDFNVRQMSKTGWRYYHYDHQSIMNEFIRLVQKITTKYDERLTKQRFLNIGFERCYNVEHGRNELTKYLIDFEDLKDKNDLLVYLRDSYGIKQRVRRGVFIWTDEWEDSWRLSFEQKKEDELKSLCESNGVFILYNSVPCSFTWITYSDSVGCYRCEWRTEEEVPIPFTNKTRRAYYKHIKFIE